MTFSFRFLSPSSFSGASLLALALAGCNAGVGDKADSTPVESMPDSNALTWGDEDGDGFLISDGDCDDGDVTIHPGVFDVCDDVDNNCDGLVDEEGDTLYYADLDGDSFGDAGDSRMACHSPQGYVTNPDDCDDGSANVSPVAPELCDEIDNDCDEEVDEDLNSTWYADVDGDGYGDPDSVQEACGVAGSGWVTNTGDCDDGEALAWSGAGETCDGVDNDCNGRTDEGLTTVFHPDADGDGYGDDAVSGDYCADPGAGFSQVGGDCDDAEGRAWTGAVESCDEVDNDCNGAIDDDAIDAVYGPADADGDGFGDPVNVALVCASTLGNAVDCDDNDAREPRVVDAAAASGGDGSVARPYLTIQEGIDNAATCVMVQPGIYTENLVLTSDVEVFSSEGAAATEIDGGAAGSVVTFKGGSAAILRGFTLLNGSGTLETSTSSESCGSSALCTRTTHRYLGGGIFIDNADPTLEDLVVSGNSLPPYSFVALSTYDEEITWSYGGGIYVNGSAGTLGSGLQVGDNYANEGGGLYLGSGGTVALRQSRFAGNAATNGGGMAVGGGTLDLDNVAVSGNLASEYGGGVWIDSGTSTLWNVTVAGNRAASGGGVAVTGSSTVGLYSSIVAASSGGVGVLLEGAGTVTAASSDVHGNAGGEWSGVADPTGVDGNLSADPLFVGWSDDGVDNDDLHLQAGSPAVDAGDASMLDADGSRADMGAYGGAGSDW